MVKGAQPLKACILAMKTELEATLIMIGVV